MRWKLLWQRARPILEIPFSILHAYIVRLGTCEFLELHSTIGWPVTILTVVGAATGFIVLSGYDLTKSIQAFRQGLSEGKADSEREQREAPRRQS